MDRTIHIALGSVVVATVVLGLKFLAYVMTGSLALYSDALESVINVAAALAALVALRIAARPADANHPYGHTKAEYFSAVAEGVLIVLAAVTILREAVPALQNPSIKAAPLSGLAVNLGASVLNAVWAGFLLRAARAVRSPALQADGRHLLTDVVTSVGVLIGVLLARMTGWYILDPLLAVLVAINILWSGWHLVRDSVGGLMDIADPQTTRRLRELMSIHAAGALEIHDLRTRQAGQVTFVEFHMVVPGEMSVSEAHLICDRLEDAIQVEIGGANVTIHVEPQEKAKHQGVLVL
ncbi:cation diffusion facilitator family transporter [Deinococcus deserti]|uniref:Putative cation efflux transporter putative membrane protein n=1 Tax=Deinococcus deserti (strain DSM 17065 / CIP 109153 / LMG 22923 / VCD115) TaxID=546414 RepID=C1CV15_DEIDV|nr:cation diffusion facilitator family transporter [Deinococcus deserti]ACO46032.1 putative cation efflux transporter; putative membrane protein [Deinococcus deserti VCD115]